MSKFITPVSMNGTKEQLEELHDYLVSIGYTKANKTYENNDKLICYWGFVKGFLEFINHQNNEQVKKHTVFIKTYNKPLFLALVSMTKGDDPIAGEYMMCIKNSTDCPIAIISGQLIKILSYNSEDNNGNPEPGHFGEGYSKEHFRKATKEELINALSNTNKIEMTHTITLNQLATIYDVACSDWKSKIREYAKRAEFPETTLEFTNDEVSIMFKAATDSQVSILKQIFVDYNKDNNPFSDINYIENVDLINKLSISIFNDSNVLQIANDSINDNSLPEYLVNRSIYTLSKYKIILHNCSNGATIIEFQNK